MPPPSCMDRPKHRRPSFMATASARQVYVQSDFSRKQGPTIASNCESFSYNPEYLRTWLIPLDIWDKCPLRLQAELEGWQAAGAAVVTGLHRIERLDNDALYRGWPVKKSGHLSRSTSATGSHAASTRAPTPPSSQSPPASFSHQTIGSPTSLPRLRTNLGQPSERSPLQQAIVDTPPFTPEDSKPIGTPAWPRSGRLSIDPLALNDRLTPFASGLALYDVPMVSSEIEPSQFDEGSWETFIRSYEAEISALKVHEAVRFRHIRRGIDQIWAQVSRDNADPDAVLVKESFTSWWTEMGIKQQRYDDDVQDLKVPDLEVIKAERLAYGMHI